MDPLTERRAVPDAPTLLRSDEFRPGPGGDGPVVAARSRPPGVGCGSGSKRRRGRRFPRFCAQGQAGDLPVPVGRAVANGPLRREAPAAPTPGDRAARLDPDGAASDGHDLASGSASRSRRAAFGSRGTARAVRRSASCCRTPRASPTVCASSSRCTPRRSITTRRSPSSRPAAQLAGRPEHRRLDVLRPGEREPGPAGVRRPDLAGLGQSRTISRSMTGSGAAGSCRPLTRASSSARSATRSSTSRIRPASRRRPGGGCSTTWPGSMRSTTASSATRRSSRASPSTRWPTGCRPRSRS